MTRIRFVASVVVPALVNDRRESPVEKCEVALAEREYLGGRAFEDGPGVTDGGMTLDGEAHHLDATVIGRHRPFDESSTFEVIDHHRRVRCINPEGDR